jgi:hypothetical protein
MADLTNYKCYNNSKYEILTHKGFKDFKGLLIGNNSNKIRLNLSYNKELICTPKHKLFSEESGIIFAEDLQVGSRLYGGVEVTSIEKYTDEKEVYEILEVSDNHAYYANGVLSHQCLVIDEMAFIEPHLVEEFWKSVFPIITSSKKSKVFVCSTSNGTDNLFYKLYDGAEKNENGWAYDMIRWDEVPGRDEKWAANTRQAIGSLEAWLQEFECQFLSSGESSIDEALFLEMSQTCIEPKIILEDGNYKIWEEPDSSRVYAAGVDISEGVGIDASTIQILDITDIKDIKQVSIYHNKNIPPLEFANKLYTILRNWGSPLALIERNNCGAQVVDRLAFDMGYEKVVSYGAKTANRTKPQMGMIAHTNTKYKGVLNMRYFINEMRAVTIRDIHTLKELKDFVRYPNGTWKAKSGYHDDRVMSLLYSLFILEKELTERYFDIIELDDHGKPSIIEPMDFGVSLFENPTSIYNDFEIVGVNNTYINPIVFGMSNDSEQLSEIELLKQQGWTQYL